MSCTRNGGRSSCPTWPMVGFSPDSPLSIRLPPCRPASQVSPSRCWLSANSFSMLICRMAPLSLTSRAPSWRTVGAGPLGSIVVESRSRNARSLNMPASSDRSCRCSSVACSGTRSTNTWLTGLPSGASKGIGCRGRTNAPSARSSPLMRPCGIAMPWPSPVEPSFSRANRLSNTTARAICAWSSNSWPTCSKRRFLLVASRSSRMLDSGSSFAIWLMAAAGGGPAAATRRRDAAESYATWDVWPALAPFGCGAGREPDRDGPRCASPCT